MQEYVLRVNHISKQFKEGSALRDISFSAENGSILGFVGEPVIIGLN